MADNDDYLRLRRMTGEVDSERYTNTDLEEFLTAASMDFNVAASLVWREKAASFAELVNISEAGSSRSDSDLYKNATSQAAYFEGLSGTGEAASTGTTTTRRIVRA